MQPCKNDSVKAFLSQMLENYKIVNAYVCENNRIYPSKEINTAQRRTLLYEFADTSMHSITSASTEFNLMKDLPIDHQYTYLGVEIFADVKMDAKSLDNQPAFRFSLVEPSNGNRKFLFYTMHELALLTQGSEFVENTWNPVGTKDQLTLNDYQKSKNLSFNLALFSTKQIDVEIKNLRLKIYGIK